MVLKISLKNELRLYYQSARFHGISSKETPEDSLSLLLLKCRLVHKMSANTDVFLRARGDYLSSRPQRESDPVKLYGATS